MAATEYFSKCFLWRLICVALEADPYEFAVHFLQHMVYWLAKSKKIESPYIAATLTRFVQPGKIEIDANERAVIKESQGCFFVCITFDSFLNDLCYLFAY